MPRTQAQQGYYVLGFLIRQAVRHAVQHPSYLVCFLGITGSFSPKGSQRSACHRSCNSFVSLRLQPFLSCQQLYSFRLHFISGVRFATLSLHSISPSFLSAASSPAAASYIGSPACRSGLRAVFGQGRILLFVLNSA